MHTHHCKINKFFHSTQNLIYLKMSLPYRSVSLLGPMPKYTSAECTVVGRAHDGKPVETLYVHLNGLRQEYVDIDYNRNFSF